MARQIKATPVAAPTRRRRAEAEVVEQPTRRTKRAVAAEAPAPTRRTKAGATKAKPARAAKPNRYQDVKPVREQFTRTSLVAYLSDRANVDKDVVKDVLAHLGNAIAASCIKRGPGRLVIPGICRIVTRSKPAVKGGKTVPDHFNPGQTRVTKDRAAMTRVRILPAKELKEIVA